MKYPYLDKIQKNGDVKKLPQQELPLLCEDIRNFLIESVSSTGGHLSSNLGVVELTVALHRALTLPQDKILFDVGHQCYTHKLLTGRREGFAHLRQVDGLSGFPSPQESDCDTFIAGHGSTALSTAIGVARAKKLKKEPGKVVAIIGDGAFTGGMVYEGMNNVSNLNNLIVVLNDNKMSISKNVGQMANYLTKLRTDPKYFRVKAHMETALECIPAVGTALVEVLQEGKKIIRRGIYHSTMFEEMGFQYELSEQFAKSLGVKLRVVVARNVQGLIKKLLAGEGDIIAYNVPITKELKDSLIYCGEEVITHQVIVQRAGGKTKPLTDVTELIGKDVYVKPGKYYDRLVNLDKELGGGIHIHKVTNDSISVEDLITQVSQGKIPYTVADNDVARLNTTYYPNLNIKLSISFDQRASWAVRKDSPELAAAANKWHEENMTSPAYTASMKRYFEISKATPHTSILSLREGKISHFDELFKKYASEIDWDWRLLASLAYTESNFDTTAVSWAGAKGLMQLMPATARAMGMPEGKEQNPEESVKAAIKYINATSKSFSSVPKEERLNFVLASYNSGIGHVQDAMALAEKYGKNKYVWKDNVENFILLKSNEEYFTDPVCKNGYFRGIETYNFVRDIMGRYETYKKKIKK